MKALLGNLLILLFSVSLCVVFAEVAVRLIDPGAKAVWTDRPPFYYVPSGAENLQGNSYEKQKPANVFRIAVVGDSFTFAPFMQYDDSFTSRLERILNLNRGARRAEVINYGVPGFSSTHEVPLAKQAIADGADLLILQITLNDPERKPYQPAGITIHQNQQGAIVVDAQGTDDSWIARHSKLYRFLFRRVNTYKQGKSYEEYFRDLYADPVALSQFEGAIREIKQLADEKQIRFVAVVFPLFGSKLDDQYPFRAIHQKIDSLLEKDGVGYLDLESAYRGIPAERLQVMPGEDFHPNEIGHRIAAEKIFCWLKKGNVLPEELLPQMLWKQRAQLLFPTKRNAKNEPVRVTTDCP